MCLFIKCDIVRVGTQLGWILITNSEKWPQAVLLARHSIKMVNDKPFYAVNKKNIIRFSLWVSWNVKLWKDVKMSILEALLRISFVEWMDSWMNKIDDAQKHHDYYAMISFFSLSWAPLTNCWESNTSMATYSVNYIRARA